MRKKLISWIIVVAMVITMVPGSAFVERAEAASSEVSNWSDMKSALSYGYSPINFTNNINSESGYDINKNCVIDTRGHFWDLNGQTMTIKPNTDVTIQGQEVKNIGYGRDAATSSLKVEGHLIWKSNFTGNKQGDSGRDGIGIGVNGGTIDVDGNIKVYENSPLVIAANGTANINGGRLHVTNARSPIGPIIRLDSGTVNVNGGNIDGGTYCIENTGGTVNVTGGHFKKGTQGFFNGNVKVKGGYFNDRLPVENIANGYFQNEEGYVGPTAEKRTVTYETTEGTCNIPNRTDLIENQIFELPHSAVVDTCPVGLSAPEGKFFKGWKNKDTGEKYYRDTDPSNITIGKENITLVPIWDANPGYTMIWKKWDGTINSVSYIEAGKAYAYPEGPTRAPDDDYVYTFREWKYEGAVLGDTVSKNCTFIAEYDRAERQCLITFYPGEHGKFKGEETAATKEMKVKYKASWGTKYVNYPEMVYDTGWGNAGWTWTKVASNETIEGEPTIITEEWKAVHKQSNVQYTVTFKDKDGRNWDDKQVVHGTDAVPPAYSHTDTNRMVKPGQAFTGWTDNARNIQKEEVVNPIYTPINEIVKDYEDLTFDRSEIHWFKTANTGLNYEMIADGWTISDAIDGEYKTSIPITAEDTANGGKEYFLKSPKDPNNKDAQYITVIKNELYAHVDNSAPTLQNIGWGDVDGFDNRIYKKEGEFIELAPSWEDNGKIKTIHFVDPKGIDHPINATFEYGVIGSGAVFSSAAFKVEGNGLYEVYAEDYAGNFSEKQRHEYKNFDFKAPVFTQLKVNPNGNGTATITVYYEDDVSGVRSLHYSGAGNPNAKTESRTYFDIQTPDLNDPLVLWLSDNAGNVSEKITYNLNKKPENNKPPTYTMTISPTVEQVPWITPSTEVKERTVTIKYSDPDGDIVKAYFDPRMESGNDVGNFKVDEINKTVNWSITDNATIKITLIDMYGNENKTGLIKIGGFDKKINRVTGPYLDKQKTGSSVDVNGVAWYTTPPTYYTTITEEGTGLDYFKFSYDNQNTWTDNIPADKATEFIREYMWKWYYTFDRSVKNTDQLYEKIVDKAGNEQIVKVNGVVNVDLEGPKITSIAANTTELGQSEVTLTVNAIDAYSGMPAADAYSFDNGQTWQTENTKKFTANQEVNVQVKDNVGHITNQKYVINNIQKSQDSKITEAPTGKTNLVYTGSPLDLLATKGTAEGGTMWYKVGDQGEWSETATATEVGNYKIYYKAVGDFNHNDSVDTGFINAEIKQAEGTASVTIDNWTYGNDPSQPVAVSDTNGISGVTYRYTGVGYDSEVAPKNAGNYKLIATFPATKSYKQVVVTKEFAIDSLEAILQWTNTSFTFDGSNKVPTAKVTNQALGDNVKVTVTGGQTDAGEGYTATAESLDNTNYKLPTANTCTFSIAKADAEYTAPVVKTNLTYDGTAKDLVTAGTTNHGTMQYKLGAKGQWKAEVPKATDAAVYEVYYKLDGDKNHNSVAETSLGEVTIEQKDITRATVTLGDALTYTGKLLTQNVAKVEIDGLLATYDVSNNTATNHGTYTLTVTGKDNFTGTATKEFTVAKADAVVTAPTANTLTYNGQGQALVNAGKVPAGAEMQYSLEQNGKYSKTIPTGTEATDYTVWYKVVGGNNYKDQAAKSVIVNIKAAPLKVTAENKTVNYGAEAPIYTVKYDGFVNNEKETVLGGKLAFECAYTAKSPAGTPIDIIPSGLTSTNYKISFANGTLTVNKADALVTAPTANTLTYNGQAQALVNAGTVPSGAEMQYSLSKTGNYTAQIPTGTDAKDYTVWYKVVGGNNYNDQEAKSVIVNIKAAPLTITAENKTVNYGVEAPKYTVKYDGFVNNETKADLGGTLGFTCKYTTESPAGTPIDIIPSGLTSTNYKISFANGTLTVNKADAVVTAPTANTLTYNGQAQALVNAGTVPAGAEMQYSLEQNGKYSTTVPTGTEATDYTVWYKVVGGNNYNDQAAKSVIVTIKQKDIANAVITLDGELTYTGSKLTQNIKTVVVDGLDVTYNVKDNTATNAGTNYKLTVTGTGNFTGTATKGFTVAKAKAPAVTYPTAGELTYGAKLSESSLTGGSTEYGTFAWADGNIVPTVKNNGYEVKFTPNENTVNNYETINKTIDTVAITVNKADAAVTAPTANTLTYNGKAQALVNAGKVPTGAEMQYSLEQNSKYSTTIPTGTDATEYTVWYKVVGGDNYNNQAAKSVTVNIAQKPLTIDVKVADKYWDGQKTATITSIALNGIVDKDEVKLVNAKAEFASENIGNDIEVTVSGYKLEGKDAANYKVDKTVTVKASISHRPLPPTPVEPEKPVAPEVVKPEVPKTPETGAEIGMNKEQQDKADTVIGNVIGEMVNPERPEPPAPQTEAEKETAKTEENIQQAAKDKEQVKINVETSKVDENNATPEVKEEISQIKNAVTNIPNQTKIKILQFLDIDVTAQAIDKDGNVRDLGNLRNLGHKLTFTIQLPADTAGNYFGVVRYHDGKAEFIPLEDIRYNAETKTIEFDTDRFSTYAVYEYEPVEVTPEPENLDTVQNLVVDTDNGLLKVTFDKVTNADNYKIYVQQDEKGWRWYGTKNNSLVIKKLYKEALVKNGKYQVKVVALNETAQSEDSQIVTVYANRIGTKSAVMYAPKFTSVKQTKGTLNVVAKKVYTKNTPKNLQYKVSYKLKGTNKWYSAGYSAKNAKSIKGLKKGKVYNLALRYRYQSSLDGKTNVYSRVVYKTVRIR